MTLNRLNTGRPSDLNPRMSYDTEIVIHEAPTVAIELALKAAFSVSWEGVDLVELLTCPKGIAWSAI